MHNPDPTIIDVNQVQNAVLSGLERRQKEDIAHDKRAAAYLQKTITPKAILNALSESLAKDPTSTLMLLSIDRDQNIRSNSEPVRQLLAQLAKNKWIERAETDDSYTLRYIYIHFAPDMIKALRAFAHNRDTAAISAYIGTPVTCAPMPELPPPAPVLATIDTSAAVTEGIQKNVKTTIAQEKATAAYLAKAITPASLQKALIKTLSENANADYMFIHFGRDNEIRRDSPALKELVNTLEKNSWVKNVGLDSRFFVQYLTLHFSEDFKKSLRHAAATNTAPAPITIGALPQPRSVPAPFSFTQKMLARLRGFFGLAAPTPAAAEISGAVIRETIPAHLQIITESLPHLKGIDFDSKRFIDALTVAYKALDRNPDLRTNDYRLATARLGALADHFRQYAELQQIGGKALAESDVGLLRNAFNAVTDTFEMVNDRALANLSENARVGLLVLDMQTQNQPVQPAPQIPNHNQK